MEKKDNVKKDELELTQEETHAKFESSNPDDGDIKGDQSTSDSVQDQKKGISPLSLDDQRNEIYKAFKKETETSEAEKKEDSGDESKPDKKNDSADSSADITEDKKGDKEEPKMVPLNALHEERKKKKQANEIIKELNIKIQSLEEAAKLPSKPTESSELSDKDDLTEREQQLLEGNKKLRIQLRTQTDNDSKAEDQQNQLKLDKVIDDLDRKLSSDGYPGFRAGRLVIDAKLKELYDSNEITMKEVNLSSTWEKVWRESVYQEFSSQFMKKDKDEIKNAKITRKKGIKSPSSPGKAPDEPQSKDRSKMTIAELNKEYFEKRVADSQRVGN